MITNAELGGIMNQGAKPAVQARSRKTRDKLVLALDELLQAKSFDQISVAEIAERAGVSAASIYRRFENKEALLPVLFDLYLTRMNEWIKNSDARVEVSDGAPLRDVLLEIMKAAWRQAGQQAHILRAVYLHTRMRPCPIEADLESFRVMLRQGIQSLLTTYKHQIHRADLNRTADMMYYFLNVIFLEKALFPSESPATELKLSDNAFIEEVADMAYGYLMTAPSGSRDRE